MKMTRYGEPQILAILRQAEGGVPVAELCREHGMMPLPGNGLSSNHERDVRAVVVVSPEPLCGVILGLLDAFDDVLVPLTGRACLHAREGAIHVGQCGCNARCRRSVAAGRVGYAGW